MLVFMPEDFEPMFVKPPTLEMANIANKKLTEYLETCPRIWKDKDIDVWEEHERGFEGDSHTARLICIEEIKKCST